MLIGKMQATSANNATVASLEANAGFIQVPGKKSGKKTSPSAVEIALRESLQKRSHNLFDVLGKGSSKRKEKESRDSPIEEESEEVKKHKGTDLNQTVLETTRPSLTGNNTERPRRLSAVLPAGQYKDNRSYDKQNKYRRCPQGGCP